MFTWLCCNFEYQFVGELAYIEDAQQWNLMHTMARYAENAKPLTKLLDWLIKNVRYDFVRRVVCWPLPNKSNILTLQSIANPRSEATIDFLEWMLFRFKKHFVADLLLYEDEKNYNVLLKTLCHPEYLKKAEDILMWIIRIYDIQFAEKILKNYEKKLFQLPKNHQNLITVLNFLSFIFRTFNQKTFEKFVYLEDIDNNLFIHQIARYNNQLEATKYYLKLLFIYTDKSDIKKIIQAKNVHGKSCLHFLFAKCVNLMEIPQLLDWLIKIYDFETMGDILLSLDNNGMTPIHYLIFNDNLASLHTLFKTLCWMLEDLGPENFVNFLNLEVTEKKFRIFDLAVRYKNDLAGLVEILDWLIGEFGLEFVFDFVRQKAQNMTLMQLIFRYNSHQQMVFFYLSWFINTFGLHFVKETFELKRGNSTILECLAANVSLSFTEFLGFIEVVFGTKFCIDLVQNVYDNKNSLFNIMLMSNHSSTEIENLLKWMEKRCPVTMRDMYYMADRDGENCSELAREKGDEYYQILFRYVLKQENL